MKKDDWKRMIDNWEASRKYANFKKKLNQKMQMNMNKKEILKAIESIKEFSALDAEDKEAFDFLDEVARNQTSKEDIVYSLIQTLLRWHFYLLKYQLKEEYELCAQIRDTIELEIDECRRMIATYFIVEPGDEQMYENIKEESLKRVTDNFNNIEE